MGLFDTLRFGSMTCPECGAVNEESEVQCKVYVGDTYGPSCAVVGLGEVIRGMPPGPLFEDYGVFCCTHCDGIPEVRLRFERGAVTSVSPLERDDDGMITPPLISLPQPRSLRKRQRRHLIQAEWMRRRQAEWDRHVAENERYATSALALAMIQPLRARLQGRSLMRTLFQVEPLGTLRQGPYRKVPGGKWERVA